MGYLQLTFPIIASQFTETEKLLEQSGALSITTADAEDQPILEPKPGETPLWQNLIITALFPENKNRRKVEKRLCQPFNNFSPNKFEWMVLEDQNWERAWLKDYQPLQFDKALWVGPQDFTPPHDVKAHLYLDPGLAFGTGTHPTTFLCLEWLAAQNLQDKMILDFGCGSGILMLAALKLGAKNAIGIDLDPQALQATGENALRNNIDPALFRLALPEKAGIFKADIILGNILANPLIELSQHLRSFLKPGGSLVLSGILAGQVNAVKAAYLPYVKWQQSTERQGWVRLYGALCL